MAKFLFLYYGGKMANTPEEAEKLTKLWMKWFQDQGKAIADQGEATMPGKTVDSSGVKDGVIGQPVTGYTVVEAGDIDTAAKIAKTNPIIADGGKIAVYPTMLMQPK